MYKYVELEMKSARSKTKHDPVPEQALPSLAKVDELKSDVTLDMISDPFASSNFLRLSAISWKRKVQLAAFKFCSL